jgi:5-carboxymethyl-2-hydroxymuconic-semialdehyde dehydrogenase
MEDLFMKNREKRRAVKHYINGSFVSSRKGGSFADISPIDNSIIARVSAGDSADVGDAVTAACNAFRSGGWSRSTPEDRSDVLMEIAEGIEANAEELAEIETLDTGIPIRQTRGQIARAAENFSFFAEMATKISGSSFPFRGQFLNYTEKRPAGVAGLITPWNTPLMLETWKIAPCLAAGDTCVLKPAEWSPLSASKLVEIIDSTSLPKGVLNVVHGLGETAGASLVANRNVRLISFTGETATGREIMKNGASSLKRFSMELGGKSPAIVFDDADMKRALDAVVFGVYSLNGERCTANSRLLLQDTIYDDFVESLIDRVSSIKIGDPFDGETELGPLIHPDHWKRVMAYVTSGRMEGANLLAGGSRPARFRKGNFLEPTLFGNVERGMKIAREEIFGPVLCAMKFSDEDEAISIANDVDYGLASYVWSRNIERAHRVASAMEAGLCWINSQNVRDLRTPFGGSKCSGIGREGGTYSFDFYMEEKTVHVALGNHSIPVFGRMSSK